MSKIVLVLDYTVAHVWRVNGSQVVRLAKESVGGVEEVCNLLSRTMRGFSDSTLRVLIDLPELDHHVERVPRMARKLQNKLLEQRKLKIYGNEPRSWVSAPLDAGAGDASDFYIIGSLPTKIPDAIAEWCQREGCCLEGVFSWPYALSTNTNQAGDSREEPSIRYVRGLSDGYLVAYNSSQEMLFFSRIGNLKDSPSVMEDNVRRIALYVEQELGLTPEYKENLSFDEMEGPDMTRLSQSNEFKHFNLVSKRLVLRQSRLLWRRRLLAILLIVLGFLVYTSMPFFDKKNELELRLSSLDLDLKRDSIAVKDLMDLVEESAIFRDVIEFSQGRETILDTAPVPSPLLVFSKVISNALPDALEIDAMECTFNHSIPDLTVEIKGRPLTPDVDLSDAIQVMHTKLASQGWQISKPEIHFEKSLSSKSRFIDARGQLRQFSLRMTVIPFPVVEP